MTTTHNLGFPRIGDNREYKLAIEGYWAGKRGADQLDREVRRIALANWNTQKQRAVDLIPVGDLPLYDHVLETSLILGNVPSRFKSAASRMDTVFLMGRGRAPSGAPVSACEMTKWFDTNYHYIVPEFSRETVFEPDPAALLQAVELAKEGGVTPKPVLVGPLTYMLLGKSTDNATNPTDFADQIADAYGKILEQLASLVEWVQIDEPLLATDLDDLTRDLYRAVYGQIAQYNSPKKLLATYFAGLGDNTELAFELADGVHADLTRPPFNIAKLGAQAAANNKVLSAGIISGRNVWRTEIGAILPTVRELHSKLGDNLWLAPSCSLLHVPCGLTTEKKLDPRIREHLAFAAEKLGELDLLRRALNTDDNEVREELRENERLFERKRRSHFIHNAAVRERAAAVGEDDYRRESSYGERASKQRKHLDLPFFPTTTIGSFPQTAAIRRTRRSYKNGALTEQEYTAAMQAEIKATIQKQEEYGLDVLVHGEPERNDMVEYFGELLDGMTVTQNGWVQSYGTRCVKPPIVYGDVSRPTPMTVGWIKYARSQTSKPVKGMLTGPVTILKWSFEREDIERERSCIQIALALRDEIADLEQAGVNVIQVDEPALREGLPIRVAGQANYLKSATDCFRLATSGVADTTQIHTHMCYSQFGEIADSIVALDADVLTIESARSDGSAVRELAKIGYTNEVGPGTYDIHSPNPPTVDDIVTAIGKVAQTIPPERLWINPDCGLKTRHWEDVEAALPLMIEAAAELRKKFV